MSEYENMRRIYNARSIHLSHSISMVVAYQHTELLPNIMSLHVFPKFRTPAILKERAALARLVWEYRKSAQWPRYTMIQANDRTQREIIRLFHGFVAPAGYVIGKYVTVCVAKDHNDALVILRKMITDGKTVLGWWEGAEQDLMGE